MKLFFDISENSVNSMTAEHYEAFERAQDGDVKLYRIRPAICHFLVDEMGMPIPQKEAEKISAKLSMTEIQSFLQQFFEIMSNKAVPKVNGSPSISPSQVQRVDSVSLDG